ncbi:hypothetical protein M3Y99_00198400 [Aphelenchoides fujianensis]|nr:hypothetical protein M3Y99_00198400 [Aphelenchoides fujianensis]
MNFRSPLAGVVASTGSTALKFASTSDVDLRTCSFWWLQLRSMGDASNSRWTDPPGIYGWAFHGEEHGEPEVTRPPFPVQFVCTKVPGFSSSSYVCAPK